MDCSREAEKLTSSKTGNYTLDLQKVIAKKQVRQNFCTQLLVEIESRLPKSAMEGHNCVNHFKRERGYIFGK